MAAMGSPLTNKYAEGYPAHRYYGGCQFVDVVENLARQARKEVIWLHICKCTATFRCAGNMAVFLCTSVKPGDTVMGMGLSDGGHLTHGSPVNFSGSYFHIVPYGVNADGFIDYDNVEKIAKECKPKLIVAGASAMAKN